MHLYALALPFLPVLTTSLTTPHRRALDLESRDVSRLQARQASGQGVISYNNYNNLPKTGGDPACGTPYGSLDINHIVSVHGNDWPGPYCGLCLQVCAVACDYFLVADSKGASGIELNNSPVSGAVMGIPWEAGASHVTGTWSTVDQSLCKSYWNGQSDNTPAIGHLPQLQALIAGG
ncbi:hypothetical protein N7G274_004634 [Stereocaulon virgatum]|uniref:Uncharacterized protein n=1 Tax=Stereocaulon virgatum TaxID=373712 RepID=A0ABR4ADU3_9LECA